MTSHEIFRPSPEGEHDPLEVPRKILKKQIGFVRQHLVDSGFSEKESKGLARDIVYDAFTELARNLMQESENVEIQNYIKEPTEDIARAILTKILDTYQPPSENEDIVIRPAEEVSYNPEHEWISKIDHGRPLISPAEEEVYRESMRKLFRSAEKPVSDSAAAGPPPTSLEVREKGLQPELIDNTEIRDFRQSTEYMAEAWRMYEEGKLGKREQVLSSFLATGLVSVWIRAQEPRRKQFVPPEFIKDEKVYRQALEYVQERGEETISSLTHMALLLDEQNMIAYTTLVKLLRDYPESYEKEFARHKDRLFKIVLEWTKNKFEELKAQLKGRGSGMKEDNSFRGRYILYEEYLDRAKDSIRDMLEAPSRGFNFGYNLLLEKLRRKKSSKDRKRFLPDTKTIPDVPLNRIIPSIESGETPEDN